MIVMTDQMKKDFLDAQQEWSDAQIQIDSAKPLQKEFIGEPNEKYPAVRKKEFIVELNEKYPDATKSDISWVFKARYKNNADEQETKFEDKKGLYESLF